ncbi:MAG: PRTRC system protein C [Bacteroidetes bacterium]|nr:PRTRC system protein C [Bacteroidota bacterium]
MAFQVKGAKRKFIIVKDNKKENIELKDPHPNMSHQEVINHYSSQYPELTTANIDGPNMEGDVAVYKFTTVLGTKG